MLQPSKTKFRKMRKGRIKGVAGKNNAIEFGKYALQSRGAARISSKQIEAARQAMTRHIKRGGKIWIRIFPHLVVTKKPQDVRMGNGKGAPDYFAARVKPGTMLFEMDGIDLATAQEALNLAAHKLPVKTKFLVKEDF